MDTLRVLSTKNLNLHSASTGGGLIHVPAKRVTRVPLDVQDHPAFEWLEDDGTLTVLANRISNREAELMGSGPVETGKPLGLGTGDTKTPEAPKPDSEQIEKDRQDRKAKADEDKARASKDAKIKADEDKAQAEASAAEAKLKADQAENDKKKQQ